jgi:hypothetical protein
MGDILKYWRGIGASSETGFDNRFTVRICMVFHREYGMIYIGAGFLAIE